MSFKERCAASGISKWSFRGPKIDAAMFAFVDVLLRRYSDAKDGVFDYVRPDSSVDDTALWDKIMTLSKDDPYGPDSVQGQMFFGSETAATLDDFLAALQEGKLLVVEPTAKKWFDRFWLTFRALGVPRFVCKKEEKE